MKHEVSYNFADGYNTVHDIIDGLNNAGYDFSYRKLQMADGTTHQFCVFNCNWLELPDLDAALKWICGDICLLKSAYDNDIITKEAVDAK